jgi:hypothetical protein
MITLAVLVSNGINGVKQEHLQTVQIVRQISADFIKTHPSISTIEVWHINDEQDTWFCSLNSGTFNLCSLTPSYPNDKWSKKTGAKIAEEGYAVKTLDGNSDFHKYTDLIGLGHYFVKFDTKQGARITFVTKDPSPEAIEEMRTFVKRWCTVIDKL